MKCTSLRDNLLFSFILQLAFLYSVILIDLIHQLAHTSGKLASQRLPQAVLGWETVFEGVDGDIIKFAVHFIIHLPISARVGHQTLFLNDWQRKEGVNTTITTKESYKSLNQLGFYTNSGPTEKQRKHSMQAQKCYTNSTWISVNNEWILCPNY